MNYVEKLHVPKWVVQLHMKNTGNKRTFVDYKLFKLYKKKDPHPDTIFLVQKKNYISCKSVHPGYIWKEIHQNVL